MAFDPEVGVTGYRIHWGTNSLQYTEHKDLGLFTEGTANPLLPGRTYYFAATAYNAACLESDYSGEVSTTTLATGSSGATSTKPILIYDVATSQSPDPVTCQGNFTFHFAFDAYINTAYQIENKATSLSSTNAWKILETYYVHPAQTNADINTPHKIACSYTFNVATNPPAQFFRVVKLP